MDHRQGPRSFVTRYHERTEHRLPDRFANSLGYLDWEHQPDPFRAYQGSTYLDLPLVEPSERDGPSWALTRSNADIEPAPLDRRSLSQLFFDSMAISAWKQAGDSQWALRCNPSSGNLHPTETYLIAGPIPELTLTPALLHYAPSKHAVGVLRSIHPNAFETLRLQLPEGAFLVGLSSIVWREAWKYGERSFRYCMHDVGHAIEAITVAARAMGWQVRRIEGVNTDQMDQLLALSASEGPEAERADVLLAIELVPSGTSEPIHISLSETALDALCPASSGSPNQLSSEHHDWPILGEIEAATRDIGAPHGDLDDVRPGAVSEPDSTSPSARALVRKRRSAVDFDGVTGMTSDQLYRMLAALVPSLTPSLWTAFPHRPRVHPLIFLHRVHGVEPGLAILIRDPPAESALRTAFTNVDEWLALPGCPRDLPLFRIGIGDGRYAAKAAHCNQDIAAEGALVVSMLASFDEELKRHGAATYRHLHWEAGALGHLLYLEAEALSLSATGIGCFFDHAIHDLVGIREGNFRMLYGTALGRAVLDRRIQTLPAYAPNR